MKGCHGKIPPPIVACDCNAHHPDWEAGATPANERGGRFAKFFKQLLNLEVLNNPSAPTRPSSKTSPDVVAADPALEVEGPYYSLDSGSDHVAVVYDIRWSRAKPKAEDGELEGAS